MIKVFFRVSALLAELVKAMLCSFWLDGIQILKSKAPLFNRGLRSAIFVSSHVVIHRCGVSEESRTR